MKKDVILALLVGFAIGSTLAVLAVKLPIVLDKQEKPKEEISQTKSEPSVIKNLKKTSLNISQPSDQAILTKDNTTLKGNTDPSTALIIESPLESIVVEPDENGSFQASLKLTEGGNPIYVTTINESGEPETKTLTLFYTTEKL
ncbi:hypothetical protein A3D78_04745 [Candidatus Gottesmanbacteria bacterium RIFCSPHIGHO2_02_FULL_39_14]|uniref:Bacterial Ig domain-containing protein n=2 Tax=Candidatus Gottesmaniibacteriota TaxID=1752720 RepID=A0A1F5ZUH8_9BACT|nr:MAG: hypothetical protein A3D78_04745 [Candidatus Gottesmanbacteria bacterium RIFCSPHIGHO2_02_FULL_39_14]OGG30965.1 MAG: hypothetical protein A3I51_02255 [Candidatus Gottesmanbacteria bacterium RIFCSPLOWO2_02_FULL_38_8]